jgi:hypothetical protein
MKTKRPTKKPAESQFVARFTGEHALALEALAKKWACTKIDVLRRLLIEGAEREGLRK